MYKRIKTLIGERYGKLLVLEKTKEKNSDGSPVYICKCDCGNIRYLSSNSLNHKKGTRSCGCARTPYKYAKSFGESAMKQRYTQYKGGAKKRGLEFDLSLEEFHNITQQNCFYCGISPKQISKGGGSGKSNGAYIYNGIDRVDNSKGYILDNCVPCCRPCNRAKDVRSKDEFFSWIKAIYEHCNLGDKN